MVKQDYVVISIKKSIFIEETEKIYWYQVVYACIISKSIINIIFSRKNIYTVHVQRLQRHLPLRST